MADKKAVSAAAKGDQAEKKAEKDDKKGGQKKAGFFTKVKNFFSRIGKYIKDTKSELKKVVWPSKKQVRVNTVTVLGRRADRCGGAGGPGPDFWWRHPSDDRRLTQTGGMIDG